MDPDNRYLRDLRWNWNEFGESDPFWAALTQVDGPDDQWPVEAFMAAGRREIDAVLARAAAIPYDFGVTARALDFGCGPGRLVQALAEHYDVCVGVDIAPSMIEVARALNRRGDRCQFVLNESDDLSIFADGRFDLVYSNLVLQHMRPTLSRKYIAEFLRITRPNGLIIFQIPDQAIDFRLPPEAYAAAITLSSISKEAAPGDLLRLTVQVQNLSPVAWPERALIRLYSNWLHESGEIVSRNPERCDIPNALPASMTVELDLAVRAPSLAGHYLLELDMIQESVACFKDHGSQPFLLPVTVGQPGRSRPATFARTNLLRAHRVWRHLRQRMARTPVMETHGIPRPEVMELMADAGARVVKVEEDFSVPTWTGFRYYVVSPG